MLNVIYEDNHVLVVIKPQNIPSQADSTNDLDMVYYVKEYLKEKYNKPGNVYVGLVHRLDRPTGGVMVFAKTSKASARLSEQIRSNQMQKKYFAILQGKPKEDKAYLKHYLLKNMKTNTVSVVPQLTTNAKMAELEYEVLDDVQGYSLAKINLYTGRSHQIRVQMKHIGTPLVNDAKYNAENYKKGGRLCLWAYELNFVHPTTNKEMKFKVAPPEIAPWTSFNISKYM